PIAGWQGRKDSNPRPSVLETDALTRLSYAPLARGTVYPTAGTVNAPTAAWQRELVATRIGPDPAPANRSRAANRSPTLMLPIPSERCRHLKIAERWPSSIARSWIRSARSQSRGPWRAGQ